MPKNKIRLDNYLFKNGFSETPEKAKKEIIAGWVKVNGETVRSPDRIITGMENITVGRPKGKFASRGGEKLEHALAYFNIKVKDKIAADIGSSTGGFTDCLLKNGAAKVYCIDVGYGLLAHKLRIDPRVVVKERTNVKDLSAGDFPDTIDFITIDLSFISVTKVFNILKTIFSSVSGIILLKPQFEAEDTEHDKGVVKNKEYHLKILKRVIDSLIKFGMIFKGLHFSPIKGPAGNIEFLLYFCLEKNSEKNALNDQINIINNIDLIIENVVNEAHDKLICGHKK
ncbi:MAG: TlyA family RNA methyltransferase [Spirochaetota bacterium]